jgi:hypothetical protein
VSTPVYDYLQLVADALSDIRVSNGYQTDLGAHVVLEPEQQQSDEGQRLVVLQTGYGKAAQQGLERTHRSVAFHVIAQVPRTRTDAQLRLHKAQADVDACLSNKDLLRTKFQLGEPAAGKPFPQLDDSTIASQVDGVDWVGVALRYTAVLRVR